MNFKAVGTGIIPDFFHDIIAYLIPGYTIFILMLISTIIIDDRTTINDIFFNHEKELNITAFLAISIISYIMGRSIERLGYWLLHQNRGKYTQIPLKPIKPKWSLIFNPSDMNYTETFKDNLKIKIAQFLNNQAGDALMKKCENSKPNQKDDYFNLIQFYLRERFPSVALYEKKQNANIILSRSLAIIFAFNVFGYFMLLYLLHPNGRYEFSPTVAVWLLTSAAFSIIFYTRYRQDQIYHAMYIFETFIATRKLFKKSK